MGRSVFGHESPQKIATALRLIVHENKSAVQAHELAGRKMEIWVDARISGYSLQEGVDRIIGTDLTIENGKLYDKGRLIGSYMTIENENDQQKAMGMAGIVEWLLVDFDNWAMIPIENLISAFNNTGTKLVQLSAQFQRHKVLVLLWN